MMKHDEQMKQLKGESRVNVQHIPLQQSSTTYNILQAVVVGFSLKNPCFLLQLHIPHDALENLQPKRRENPWGEGWIHPSV